MKKGPRRFQEARFMKHMELKILWTCGLLMMCLQDARSANPDIKLLTSATVWKGSCLMLPCTYNAKVTSDKIIWFHNAEYDYLNHKFFGAVVYDSKNITNVDQLFAGRVEFIGNLKKDPADCTIVIKDIQSQHEGRYQLRLWGKSNTDKWMFQNITVTAPETGPTLQIDSPTEMRESDTVSITCNIQYYCPFNNITLYWIEEMNGTSTTDISKDRNGLRTGTSSRLEIHPSWKDDKKNVTCVLEGDNGEAENQTIQLNVKHAPKNVQVLPKNATIKIKQNQSVTLTCSVESSNPPDYEITWFKDNRPQRQTSKNGSPNQFEVRYPGKYFCKAKNIIGEMPSNSVEVIVLHPPEKTVIKKPQGMLKEGMDISLECSTKANPPAFLYIWYKDSEMCYNNTSAWFRISKITEDDSGSYTCLARNELGESRSDVVELDVMYAPRYPKIYLQRGEEQFDEKEQFIFVEGDRVNFECKVNSSNPDVTELLWNKNGKSIGKTSNPIKAEDAGSYTCEAKNNIGSSTSLPVNLEVLYPPKGVDIVIPKRKVKENETVRLKCISNTSKPEIKAYEWYKDSVLLQSSSSDVLELRLEWTHTGSYSCKALNDIGSGMSSMKQIDVQYAPQNVTLKVIPGEHVTEFTDVKLTCTSKANPDVLGYKFYRNNVLLGDRNRYVDLTDVKIENAGAYYCTVENYVGEGRSNVISLHVSYSQATIGKLSAIWIFSIIALLLLIYLSFRFGICIRNAFRKKGVNDKGDSSFFILKKTNQESADNTGRQMSMMHSSTDHLNYSTVNLPPPSRKRINPPSTTPDNDITTVYSVVGKVRNAAEYENISTSKTNHEDSQDDIHYSIITNLNKNTKNLERDPDVEYAKLRHS